ncbi:hypothetical protein FKP32DRAFT_1067437 [Trametes sanguinea]|nr:hypothetical protein FKP32DRAFT_1067437 [Trametes sanguinea]
MRRLTSLAMSTHSLFACSFWGDVACCARSNSLFPAGGDGHKKTLVLPAKPWQQTRRPSAWLRYVHYRNCIRAPGKRQGGGSFANPCQQARLPDLDGHRDTYLAPCLGSRLGKGGVPSPALFDVPIVCQIRPPAFRVLRRRGGFCGMRALAHGLAVAVDVLSVRLSNCRCGRSASACPPRWRNNDVGQRLSGWTTGIRCFNGG